MQKHQYRCGGGCLGGGEGGGGLWGGVIESSLRVMWSNMDTIPAPEFAETRKKSTCIAAATSSVVCSPFVMLSERTASSFFVPISERKGAGLWERGDWEGDFPCTIHSSAFSSNELLTIAI